jgi:hypothetical protein
MEQPLLRGSAHDPACSTSQGCSLQGSTWSIMIEICLYVLRLPTRVARPPIPPSRPRPPAEGRIPCLQLAG